MAKSSKSKQQDQQTSKLQVEVRYVRDTDGRKVPEAIMLNDGEIYKVTKIHSVKHPSPFLDDPNTRYKVSVSVDGFVSTLQLFAHGSSGYVEAV